VKKIFSILFALVLVVGLGLTTTVPAVAEPGTTYYVSTTGDDDTGDGTVGNPWRTIQKAIDALNVTGDGDTIMVAAGEYEAFQVIEKTNISIISTAGATVTTANLVSVDVAPIEDAWVMAGVRFSENINIEGISFDGTDIIGEEVIVGAVYIDSTGRIADLAVENILGADLAAGIVIIGDTGTSEVELSDVVVENSMAGVAVWNAEASLNGCTVTGTDAGVVIAWPLAEFAPSTVGIRGSTIVGNDQAGIWVCDDSIVSAHFNNIVGNTDYGLRNDGGETVNAIYNWWGDSSGPSGLGPGDGDAVSDNVNFEPWLESASVTQTVTNDSVYAEEAATIVEVHNCTAKVTISKYAGNPYPEASIEEGGGGEGEGELTSLNIGTLQTNQFVVPDLFRDILITRLEGNGWVRIKIYYTDDQIADLDEGSLEVCWTNEEDPEYYQKCSTSSVVPHPQYNIMGNDYSGYIWALIDDETIPRIDQLIGTTFGGYGSGGIVPDNGCGCFIATAAYGTDTAEQLDILREFRDTVLLPNRLGAEFVSLYYRASPPLADFISQNEVLRTIARVGFVDPLVRLLTWTHNSWSP
jgi:hypothetical protein